MKPFIYACKEGITDIVDYLLEYTEVDSEAKTYVRTSYLCIYTTMHVTDGEVPMHDLVLLHDRSTTAN